MTICNERLGAGYLLERMMSTTSQQQIDIDLSGVVLPGDLVCPPLATGLVLFAHGSGSSRLSPRNRYVAGHLNHAGIATLLTDLLLAEEDVGLARRFDIGLLAARLEGITRAVRGMAQLGRLRLGYFGASTGAAAAIRAAAMTGGGYRIDAVVSRGGRPDLAGHDALAALSAPTLLIVGGADTEVLHLNERAYAWMSCEKHFEIVAGATHLFEEPGALEVAARLAAGWFATHLAGRRGADPATGEQETS